MIHDSLLHLQYSPCPTRRRCIWSAGIQEPPNAEYDLTTRLITFSGLVMDIVSILPDTRVGNHVAGQLLRAGTAPAAGYAEALGAESRRDFVHKLKVSLKELRETAVWLQLVRRKELGDTQDLVASAERECDELTAIFVASISTARRHMEENERQGTPVRR